MNSIAASSPALHPALRFAGWLLACAAVLSAPRLDAADCPELLQYSFKRLQTGETQG